MENDGEFNGTDGKSKICQVYIIVLEVPGQLAGGNQHHRPHSKDRVSSVLFCIQGDLFHHELTRNLKRPRASPKPPGGGAPQSFAGGPRASEQSFGKLS